jgi:hypothetical protein
VHVGHGECSSIAFHSNTKSLITGFTVEQSHTVSANNCNSIGINMKMLALSLLSLSFHQTVLHPATACKVQWHQTQQASKKSRVSSYQHGEQR